MKSITFTLVALLTLVFCQQTSAAGIGIDVSEVHIINSKQEKSAELKTKKETLFFRKGSMQKPKIFEVNMYGAVRVRALDSKGEKELLRFYRISDFKAFSYFLSLNADNVGACHDSIAGSCTVYVLF